MRTRHMPQQLPLLDLETSALKEQLAGAYEYSHDLDRQLQHTRQELAQARTSIADLQTKLDGARQAGRYALDMAYSRIETLQTQCDFLYDLLKTPTKPSSAASPPDEGALSAWMRQELTKLLTVCHPDKWHGNPAAEELTKHVIAIRQRM
jgi:hypothetical protein